MKRLVLCLALVLGLAESSAGRAEPRLAPSLVTVELFTSQGCSSCPAADGILSELADRPDLLALTLPVDYWDYLGWRDTLARPEHTKRQYAYAKSLKTYQPYTPQIVIDGLIDVVGNNKSRILWAIEDRLKRRPPPVPISFDPGPDSVAVLLGAGAPASATVWLVRYGARVSVKIDRGENEGRTLSYSHVVESMAPIGMWTGAAERLVLPRADLLGAGTAGAARNLAIILQMENTGPIIGAARLPAE